MVNVWFGDYYNRILMRGNCCGIAVTCLNSEANLKGFQNFFRQDCTMGYIIHCDHQGAAYSLPHHLGLKNRGLSISFAFLLEPVCVIFHSL